MYQLSFYVPNDASEKVKNALFAAGVGRINDYDQCAWECPGQGQFRPLADANPTEGERHKLHRLAELKVEMVCEDHLIHAAISALKKAHPYEEPAYSVVKLEEF